MNVAGPLLDIVFFDVDDTLYSTTTFAEQARRNAVRGMIAAGLRVEEEAGVAELTEVVAEFSSNYANHLGCLLARLGPSAVGARNAAVLIAAGVVAYHQSKAEGLVILPDAREVLQALHDAGVRLGVITAGLQVKQAEKLIRIGALDYFDPTAIFFSDQVGISKPNPKLYAQACARSGVEPRRAMYVGDRPAHDIAPANAAGMTTVLYTGAGGRYARQPHEEVRPDHTLADLRDLVDVLRRYGCDL